MAEIRKKALIASGAQIEGLQQQQAGGPAKKVVYGNRKKNVKKEVTESRPRTPEPEPEPEPPKEQAKEEVNGKGAAKDDWDDSSEGENEDTKKPEGVKDDWDASSEEETEKSLAAPVGQKKAQTPSAQKGSCSSIKSHRVINIFLSVCARYRNTKSCSPRDFDL